MEKGGQPIRADGCGWQRCPGVRCAPCFCQRYDAVQPGFAVPAYGNQPWERQFIQVLVEDWKVAAPDMGFSRPSNGYLLDF